MNARLAVACVLAFACANPTKTATEKTEPPAKGLELSDMDRKANPCDDFYEFANGSWRAHNPIPASMQRWSRRWQAGESNKEKLRLILEELSARTDWPKGSIEAQVRDFNAACMDEEKVDALGLSPLQPMLAELDALQTPADVQRAIRMLEDLNLSAPFGVGPQPDAHEPSRTILEIGAGGLGLPDRDYYLKPEPRFAEAREKYRAHLRRMFELASFADPQKTADTVYAFESRLATASLDNVALRNPAATDHPTSFAQLRTLTPHFDWTLFFEDGRIPEADLNVDQPEFMRAFDRELAQTDVAQWRMFLEWKLLDASAPWLSKPFVDEWFGFNQKFLSGVSQMKPRGVRCAELADRLLGEALGKKYVERYFPPAAKARVQELVHNELAAMKDIVEHLDWMGPETKAKALHKIATFNPKVGYPDKWRDYSSVKVKRDTLLENIAAAQRFEVRFEHGQMGKPTDRALWGMTPPTSDAYYNPLLNEIVFPAGILQPPAFDLEASDAVNYGAIGVVIGHEISHGFDDQGAQYDAEGRLSNWWTKEDLARFQERTSCVVDQFEGYFIEPGIHHNGKLVLGESIGDLAGARVAYLAFEKAQAAHPWKPRDGFTPEQEFFIAWGQFRGDEIRPETQRLMIQGDPHPIARFRVIGPLSNLTEFQRAFSCPAQSNMVRQNRCDVW
ncbi:MAG TPA: M13 family metallopeptidase [Myxococcales bacterium]